MTKTFENDVVRLPELFDNLIRTPIELFIAYVIIILIIKHFFYKKNEKFKLADFPIFLWDSFKMFAYGFLAAIVFFYNFQTRHWSLNIESTMLLSTAFVGILAIYETISNAIEVIKLIKQFSKPE